MSVFHKECSCHPTKGQLLLNRFKSNTDISTATELRNLQTYLRCVKKRTTLTTSGPDGLCTNCEGFSLISQGIRSARSVYRGNSILGGYSRIRREGNSHDNWNHSESWSRRLYSEPHSLEVVQEMVQISLNKVLYVTFCSIYSSKSNLLIRDYTFLRKPCESSTRSRNRSERVQTDAFQSVNTIWTAWPIFHHFWWTNPWT